MFFKLLFLCVINIVIVNNKVNGARLPAFIKPCSVKDPDHDKCYLDHGKAAIPHLLKGVKKFNIPSLSPLELPFLALKASKELTFNLTDLVVKGLEKTELKKVKNDHEKKTWSVDLFIPAIEMTGQYDMNGKILVLPIVGKGPFNITAVDGLYKYSFKYELIKKGDKEYANILDDKLDMDLKRIYFQLDNLFNGDERLGAEMNKFLNENWKEVHDDIGGVISESIAIIAKTIAANLIDKVPYNEIIMY